MSKIGSRSEGLKIKYAANNNVYMYNVNQNTSKSTYPEERVGVYLQISFRVCSSIHGKFLKSDFCNHFSPLLRIPSWPS